MAIISTFPIKSPLASGDLALISDSQDNLATKNATMASIKEVIDVVDTFTSSFGTYITGVSNTSATGAVVIGNAADPINLSAIDGTSVSGTRFLSKDNTWDVPASYTGGANLGFVPAGGNSTNFLKGDGTWGATVSSVTAFTASDRGIKVLPTTGDVKVGIDLLTLTDLATQTAGEDFMLVLDDPNGIPINKKVSVNNFLGSAGLITNSSINYSVKLPNTVGAANQILKLPSPIGTSPYQLAWADDTGGGGGGGGVTTLNTLSGAVTLTAGTNVTFTTSGNDISISSSGGGGGGGISSITGTTPVAITSGSTPVVSMVAASTSVSGYLTTTDWNTFNNKTSSTGTVTEVSGTGTVSGISLSGTVNSTGSLTLGGTLSLTSANVTGGLGFTPYNSTNPSGFTSNAGTVTSLVFSSPLTGGTITTSGTVSMPAATTSNSGYLTQTDWNTFNTNAGGGISSITGTSPIAATSGSTPVISMPASTSAVSGYLTSTDWSVFNGKTSNAGTVTSVAGTGAVSGLTLSGEVTSSGNITLGGTLSLTSANITTGLGFTPYNSTNPSGFTSNAGTVTSITSGADSGTATAITTSGTLTFTGGTNVTTSVSGTTVTINSSDQYAGTVTGSGTANRVTKWSTGGTGIENSLITDDGSSVSIDKLTVLKGAGSINGKLQLNCSANSHYVELVGPVHSGGVSYSLQFPNTIGTANQVLKLPSSPGANNLLVWGDASAGVTGVSATAPVASSGGSTPSISMAPATTSADGYLTTTDWNTFNNKSDGAGVTSISFNSPLSGGTVTGTGVVGIPQSNGDTDGYLSYINFNVFNNKADNSGVTSVNGTATQIISSGGTTPNISLASVSPSPAGSYTNANITVDIKGRVATASSGSGEGGQTPCDYALGDDIDGTSGNIQYFYIFTCNTTFTIDSMHWYQATVGEGQVVTWGIYDGNMTSATLLGSGSKTVTATGVNDVTLTAVEGKSLLLTKGNTYLIALQQNNATGAIIMYSAGSGYNIGKSHSGSPGLPASFPDEGVLYTDNFYRPCVSLIP